MIMFLNLWKYFFGYIWMIKEKCMYVRIYNIGEEIYKDLGLVL